MDSKDKELQYETKLYLIMDKIVDAAINRYSQQVDKEFKNHTLQLAHVIEGLEKSNKTLEALTEHVKAQNGNVAAVKRDVVELRHLRALDVQEDKLSSKTKELTCPFREDIIALKNAALTGEQEAITKKEMKKYLKTTLWVIVAIVSIGAGILTVIDRFL